MQARPGGPLGLGATDRERVLAQSRGGSGRLAGDRASLVASLAAGDRRRARVAVVSAARSSRPRTCPWPLGAEDEQRILDARERTQFGPARLAGYRRSTVWKVLRATAARAVAGRARAHVARYEWAEPGALLHIDASSYSALTALTLGHRRQRSERSRSAAPAELLRDLRRRRPHPAGLRRAARARTGTRRDTLRRAAAWMREQGCGPAGGGDERQRECLLHSHAFGPCWTSSAPATSASRPTRRAGTARWSASSSTLEDEWAHGRVWPKATNATAARHPFCATTTAADPTLTRRPATHQPRSPSPRA